MVPPRRTTEIGISRTKEPSMSPSPRAALLALTLALCPAVTARGAAAAVDTEPALADRAGGILRQYCYRCHGREFKVEGYNVLDRAGLAAPREGEQPYVTPGKPDDSEMWARID